MKKTKQILSVLLVFIVMLSFVGCSKPASNGGEGALFKAGTYTAKAKGLGGDVEVEMILTETTIESVKVLSHSETPGISDPAIEQIPANIVAAQGLKIDAVSGATVTSEAILAAVIDCLTQAGANIEELKTKGLKAVVLEDETIETDVVVVGSGIAGLSAAVSAAEEGAKVVLLEKMGSVGGASITCGGEILAGGSEMQAAQGIEDTAEGLKQYWLEVGKGKINEEIISFIADKSADTVKWLAERGVKFRNVTFSYYYPTQSVYRNHATETFSGADFILPLQEKAKSLGVEFRFETPAVSLINDKGTIKGVVAKNAGRTVTVNAKSTILATGGYANNKELVEQYMPNVKGYGSALGEALNGDGLIMAREVGAEIVANGGGIVAPMDLGATRYVDAGGIFLNVTPEGKRFANENEYWFKRAATLYHDLGFSNYFAITDSKLDNENLEKAVENGTAFKADTIEELAKFIGAKPEILKATVTRYNGFAATGKDEDFGKPAVGPVGNREDNLKELQLLNAVDQAPYYAIAFNTTGVTGTFGGPKIDMNAQVISTTGDVIPGLYAAGEVANGELFYEQYPCSGSSIQMSTRMGIQAGKAAAAAK